MGDYIEEYYRALLRGILGVQTIAHIVASKVRGPQYRPQYTIILICISY